jgi:hypothetical protein
MILVGRGAIGPRPVEDEAGIRVGLLPEILKGSLRKVFEKRLI